MTLSLAYLYVYTNQTNRIAQSTILRSSIYNIESALSPSIARAPPPPTRLDLSGTIRPSLIAELKEKWNAELLAAARKVQNTDWAAVRDGLEDSILRLYYGEGYASPQYSPEAIRMSRDVAATAVRQVQETVLKETAKSKNTVDEQTSNLSSRLQEGYRGARDQVSNKVHDLEDRAHRATDAAREQMQILEDKATHAYASAKAQIHMAEESFEKRADKKLLQMDEVERTLQQRYESIGLDGRMEKTAEELLEERYKPVSDEKREGLKGI